MVAVAKLRNRPCHLVEIDFLKLDFDGKQHQVKRCTPKMQAVEREFGDVVFDETQRTRLVNDKVIAFHLFRHESGKFWHVVVR